MSKRFFLILLLLLSTSFYFGTAPEAEAIDPVTIAVLTPIAIQAAKILMPYVLKALRNMAVVFLRGCKHLIGLIRLPLGLVQCLLFQYKAGLTNLWHGITAPFKFGGNMLLLPISIFGIGV
ncbi:MAG: hypothetical protein IKB22_09170 [Lentisphaeria bacterium]|nr:hypothetical protein [Lentisphaeria bacterium]